MSAIDRLLVTGVIGAAVLAAGTPIPTAEAHGDRGHGGAGFSAGGHLAGGGGWGNSHVGSHVGSGWATSHVGGWTGRSAMSGRVWAGRGSSALGLNRYHSPTIHSFAAHTGTWNHALAGNFGVWNGTEGVWNHREPDRDDFFSGSGFVDWPWYAYDWGPSSWWPGYEAYGGPAYGVLDENAYGSAAIPGAYDSGGVPYAGVASASTVLEPGPPEVGTEGADFYSKAVAAFRRGDYRDAARLAAHAAVDDPRNVSVHVLGMLGLFAEGEYRGAAMEAHVVAALGQVPDWPTVYHFYGDLAPYTEQLRKLEKFVTEHPSAAEGRFLLGFQYLAEGHKHAAADQFALAVKLVPQDTIAAKLLAQQGGAIVANKVKEGSSLASRPSPQRH